MRLWTPSAASDVIVAEEPEDERFEQRLSPIDGRFASELRDLLVALGAGHGVRRIPQCLVVTGLDTSAETPIIASSLAITCAISGYRVLLVDANLDQPRLHLTFGASNDAGLSNLLGSSDPPHRLPKPTSIPNLSILVTGPRVRNHASLLAREQVLHRLAPIAGAFEYIIIDCTAITPVLVARVAGGADNVIMVVRRHVSSMRELANTVEILRAEGVVDPTVLMIE
jgi:Mrp family chromosome partitioning ATPase